MFAYLRGNVQIPACDKLEQAFLDGDQLASLVFIRFWGVEGGYPCKRAADTKERKSPSQNREGAGVGMGKLEGG